MGEIADEMIERYGYPNEDGPPEPEDYLDMTDDELRKATAKCRNAKLVSIRNWPSELSPKQRYCLAAWLADRDSKTGTPTKHNSPDDFNNDDDLPSDNGCPVYDRDGRLVGVRSYTRFNGGEPVPVTNYPDGGCDVHCGGPCGDLYVDKFGNT